MNVAAPSPKYSAIARIFHWVVAVGIVSAFTIAVSIDGKPLHTKFLLINYHKWVGITVLGLVVLRAAWRLTHRPPGFPDHMNEWETRIAHLGHLSLYVLMFAVPIGGWTYSNAAGFPVVWLGMIPLPNLVEKNKALADLLKQCHELGGWTLVVIASLHALVALKHQFIDKDRLLQRMI